MLRLEREGVSQQGQHKIAGRTGIRCLNLVTAGVRALAKMHSPAACHHAEVCFQPPTSPQAFMRVEESFE